MQGKYKIELRCAVTKKVQKVVESENAITLGVNWANYCGQMSSSVTSSVSQGRSGVGSIQSGAGGFPSTETISNRVYNANTDLFNRLFLTDNAEPVDDMTPLPLGEIIATAWNETVDTDMRRGFFQRNLSLYTNKWARYVFTFDHQRGNGTFRSAFMSRERSVNERACNYMAYNFGANVNPGTNGRAFVLDGDVLRFVSGTHLYEVNYKTCQLIRRVLLPEAASTAATTVCQSGLIGRDFYYINANNQICRLNLDTLTITARVAETMFFEQGGSIYAPVTGTRTLRRYRPDLSLAETLTVGGTVNFTNSTHSINFDKQLGRLIFCHNLTSVAFADFLALGLVSGTQLFGLSTFSSSSGAGNSASFNNVFFLDNGNALMCARADQLGAGNNLIQAYKYQGLVGSAIMLPEPVTKTSEQEMTVTYDIRFSGKNFVV
jgi:hypothetical protein